MMRIYEKKFSDEQIRGAMEEAGSYRAAAKLLGMTPPAVRYRCLQLGIPGARPHPRPLSDHHEKIVEMSGFYSAREIAAEIGGGVEAVRKYMVRHDIPRLPGKARPEKNAFWLGGRKTGAYRSVPAPKDHPHRRRNGHIAEHRLVMEQKIGRYLEPGEVVHHIDEDRLNNHPDNLMLFASHADHMRHHILERKEHSLQLTAKRASSSQAR